MMKWLFKRKEHYIVSDYFDRRHKRDIEQLERQEQ